MFNVTYLIYRLSVNDDLLLWEGGGVRQGFDVAEPSP